MSRSGVNAVSLFVIITLSLLHRGANKRKTLQGITSAIMLHFTMKALTTKRE